MKPRWAAWATFSISVLGALSAPARAEVVLGEYSGYTLGIHYGVIWHPDPVDPNEPAQPEIRIIQDIYGLPFWFDCYDDATEERADIFGILGDPELDGSVAIKVVAGDGVGYGARHVGMLYFDYPQVTAVLQAFKISGTLATRDESYVGCISGPFSAADIHRPFHVDQAISAGGVLMVTGPGPHYGDITVKSLVASPLVGDEIQITGDYLASLTLGSVG